MKPLKLPSDDKELSAFNERLAQAERKAQIEEEGKEREETPAEREHKMAELRVQRMKVYKAAGVTGDDACRICHDMATPYEIGEAEYNSEYRVNLRKKAQALLAQRTREHQEWLALSDSERQVIIAQRTALFRRKERWWMENQRGALGPIGSDPPDWWIEQYEKSKHERQKQ